MHIKKAPKNWTLNSITRKIVDFCTVVYRRQMLWWRLTRVVGVFNNGGRVTHNNMTAERETHISLLNVLIGTGRKVRNAPNSHQISKHRIVWYIAYANGNRRYAIQCSNQIIILIRGQHWYLCSSWKSNMTAPWRNGNAGNYVRIICSSDSV